jgi:uncharacterized membrane protein YfcA
MMNVEPLQWAIGALGAFMVGVSKTGIAGLSVLFVALFVHVFPSSKQASGLVLPLLIFGDCIAVLAYRRHAQWRFLRRLFPWTAVGVVLGYFALGHISDRSTRYLIGGIIISLASLSYWWRFGAAKTQDRAAALHWSVGASIGVIAGFITLVANAAGPLMSIYFIAMRLPKMEFVGTAAVFFMLLNLFKVPFMVDLGLITAKSFEFNLILAPAVLLGTIAGRWLLTRVNQGVFEQLVLGLSAIAGLLLIL